MDRHGGLSGEAVSSCLCIPDVPSLVSLCVGRTWLWNIPQSRIQCPQGRAWFPCSYGSRAWWGHSAPFWMPTRGCVSLCPVSSFPLPGHTHSVSAASSPSGLPCCPLTRLFLGKGLYGLDMWIIVFILFGGHTRRCYSWLRTQESLLEAALGVPYGMLEFELEFGLGSPCEAFGLPTDPSLWPQPGQSP